MMTDRQGKGKTGASLLAALGATAVVLAFSSRYMSYMDPKWLVLAVVGLLCAVTCSVGGTAWKGRSPFRWLWVLLACTVAIHLTVAQPLNGPAHWLAVAKISALLLTAEALLGCTAGDENRQRLWAGFFVGGVVSAALALAQYGGFANALFPERPAFGQSLYGVFGNQAIGAAYWVGVLPLAMLLHRESRPTRWALGAGVVVLTTAILLSGSRGAWIALGVVLVWGAIRDRRRVRPILFAASLAVTAVLLVGWPTIGPRVADALSGDSHSFGLRVWFLDGTVRMIADHGVWGVGAGNYGSYSPIYLGRALWVPGGEGHVFNEVHTRHAHVDLLELLAEHGAVVVIALAVLAFYVRWQRWDERYLCLVALFVTSCFNPILSNPPHGLLGLCLLGSVMTVAARGEGRVLFGVQSAVRLGLMAAAGLWIWGFGVSPNHALRDAMDRELAGEDGLSRLERTSERPFHSPLIEEKLGVAYMTRGDYVRGREAFRRAIAGGARHGDVWLGRALCSLYVGAREEARESAEACLAVWPADRDAWAVNLATSEDTAWEALHRQAERWLGADEWVQVCGRASELRRFLHE